MDSMAARELLMPVVHPSDLWERTGRFHSVGSEMARLKDRWGRDMVLAMTHEEVATDLGKWVASSYRQLPLCIYHFQTKFRDEPRPRGGLLRVREFTMKDAYSFNTDLESQEATYLDFMTAYLRAFRRCGIEPAVVESTPAPCRDPAPTNSTALRRPARTPWLSAPRAGTRPTLKSQRPKARLRPRRTATGRARRYARPGNIDDVAAYLAWQHTRL